MTSLSVTNTFLSDAFHFKPGIRLDTCRVSTKERFYVSFPYSIEMKRKRQPSLSSYKRSVGKTEERDQSEEEIKMISVNTLERLARVISLFVDVRL